MWGNRYWPNRYWADRYWPPGGAVVVTAATAHRTNDGAWMPRPRIIRESLADRWLKRRRIAATLSVLIDG